MERENQPFAKNRFPLWFGFFMGFVLAAFLGLREDLTRQASSRRPASQVPNHPEQAGSGARETP